MTADRVPSDYRWEDDRRIAPFRAAAAVLTERLQTERPVDRAVFDALWRTRFDVELGDAPPEQKLREYGAFHARRFWETANAMAVLLAERPAPRVLDFGISVFLAFYRRLFPRIELVTSDQPVADDMRAFFARVAAAAGAVRHVTADLSDPGFLTEAARSEFGVFDLIVFTEVLEHLPVHPVHVLRNVVQLLRADGHVYLTTPNHFSRAHLDAIARRINPQCVFPYDGNAGGEHHYREFEMAELLQFAAEAGAEPVAFYFSDCWDADPVEPPDQRSNMIVVLRRRAGR